MRILDGETVTVHSSSAGTDSLARLIAVAVRR